MINKKSDYLTIMVATYNRIDLLKKVLDSIINGTKCSFEIIVIDGGSTDGTVNYLKLHPSITSVLQGELLGTARAYNEVWRQINSRFSCWLSDDTEVVNGSLDLAVEILESNPNIGMVGLKMKDVIGKWKNEPYMGGLSKYGILNCNHGVLKTNLARSLGFFNEDYRSYMIDPDLTASVLCTGKIVVMTKNIKILHHREWIVKEGLDKKVRDIGGVNIKSVYLKKFNFLTNKVFLSYKIIRKLSIYLNHFLLHDSMPKCIIRRINRRTWINIIKGRFIRIMDSPWNKNNPYHLVQKIPHKVLLDKENPYYHLVK